MLKDIYYLDAAETEIRLESDNEPAKKIKLNKSTKKALRFAKTIAVTGNFLAAALLLPVLYLEGIGRYFSEEDLIMGGLTTMVTTAWIPFVFIVMGKFFMKRSPKKHEYEVDALVRRICSVAENNPTGMQEMREDKVVGMRTFKGLRIASAVFCISMYVGIFAPMLPKIEPDAIQIGKDSQQAEDKENNVQEEIVEQTPSTNFTETEKENTDEDWYNDPNSNGYGFEISNACLDAYLAYVQSGEAKESFAKAQKEKQSSDYVAKEEGEIKYFTIAGMEKPEPYLILASRNDNTVSDEVTFYHYRGEQYGAAKESVSRVEMFEADYDMMSMADTMTVNNLYVFCVDQKNKALYYEETVITHNRHDTGEKDYFNYLWIYKMQDGVPIEKRSGMKNRQV